MKIKTRFAVLAGALALALTPAAALAQGVEYAPAHPEHPAPGPKASLPEKAKAYGVYCHGFSKKHAAGEKGTPFSQCVTAVAKAVSGEGATAREACRAFPKQHTKSGKGTPFSRCVVAVAQAKKSAAAQV